MRSVLFIDCICCHEVALFYITMCLADVSILLLHWLIIVFLGNNSSTAAWPAGPSLCKGCGLQVENWSIFMLPMEVFVTEIKMESSKHYSFWSQSRNHDKINQQDLLYIFYFAKHYYTYLWRTGYFLYRILVQPLPSNNSGTIEQNKHYSHS